MPFQITRPLALFLLLFAGFVGARHLLVPPSFGAYGHYRGDSVQECRSLELHYAGAAACRSCHAGAARAVGGDGHRGLSCETCHGPGAVHARGPRRQKLASPDSRESCAHCHAFNPSRPAAFPQVDLKTHWAEEYGTEKCVTCHEPHEPSQK